MSAPTPGPWVVEAHTTYPTDAVRISGPDGFQIAATRQLHEYRPDKTAAWYEARANARLMAAAPDLLEALKGLMDIPSHDGTQETSAKRIAIKRAARAAIERAEGHA